MTAQEFLIVLESSKSHFQPRLDQGGRIWLHKMNRDFHPLVAVCLHQHPQWRPIETPVLEACHQLNLTRFDSSVVWSAVEAPDKRYFQGKAVVNLRREVLHILGLG